MNGMRIPIPSSRDLAPSSRGLAQASGWIRCCCVLHNLVITNAEADDDFLDAPEPANDEEGDDNYIRENDDASVVGREKRELIKRLVLQRH